MTFFWEWSHVVDIYLGKLSISENGRKMLVMLHHMENLVISELDDLNKLGKKKFFFCFEIGNF